MNEEAFLRLFGDGNETRDAAESWWNAFENCKHPCNKLAFVHWERETRAELAIAHEFRMAFELDLVEKCLGSGPPYPFELWEMLLQKCSKEGPPADELRFGEGSRVNLGDLPTNQGITFIELKVESSVQHSYQVRESALEEVRRRKQSNATRPTWITPSHELPADVSELNHSDQLRDMLGTAHWKRERHQVALVWQKTDLQRCKIPTILDGRWPFFRPSGPNADWGYTVDLSNGEQSCMEGVSIGIFDNKSLGQIDFVKNGGDISTWRLREEYSPEDGDEMCSYPCNLSERILSYL